MPKEPRGEEEVWYSRGLRFGCEECGSCCRGPSGYVWVTIQEIEAIARFRNEPPDATARFVRWVEGRYSLKERIDGDCIFFQPVKGCSIYPVRPAQCSTWPFWESNLRSREVWERVRLRCPGIGRGKWYSADRVKRRSRVVRS